MLRPIHRIPLVLAFLLAIDALCPSVIQHHISTPPAVQTRTAQYCTALHIIALHCTVMHCSIVQCNALHGTAQRCTARYHSALKDDALNCTILHCTVLYCSTVQFSRIHCTAFAWHSTIGYLSGTNIGIHTSVELVSQSRSGLSEHPCKVI